MAKFRKKPLVVEAVQWTGNNWDELSKFASSDIYAIDKQGWFDHSTGRFDKTNIVTIQVRTLEGDLYASMGDWIIKGISNEFYPCKPEIFEKTYERIEEPCKHCGQVECDAEERNK